MGKDTGAQTPLRGTSPTAEEIFLLKWGQELLKENLKTVNDILRHHMTLVAALLAATIALRGANLLSTPVTATILSLLLGALLTAWAGVMPYRGSVDVRQPEALRVHKDNALRFRLVMLWTSASLLIAGLLAGGIGVLLT